MGIASHQDIKFTFNNTQKMLRQNSATLKLKLKFFFLNLNIDYCMPENCWQVSRNYGDLFKM